jgi:hypothetical protein
MGGRAAFGAGGSTFACVFSTTGEGAILISIVLFLEGCFLAETGLGGCSSGTWSVFDLLVDPDRFSLASSLAGVFGCIGCKGAGSS